MHTGVLKTSLFLGSASHRDKSVTLGKGLILHKHVKMGKVTVAGLRTPLATGGTWSEGPAA